MATLSPAPPARIIRLLVFVVSALGLAGGGAMGSKITCDPDQSRSVGQPRITPSETEKNYDDDD